MSLYTVTTEIKFGHRVDQRGIVATIADAGSSILLEIKVKDGVYVPVKSYTFTNGTSLDVTKHHEILFTRGLTYKFTVTGNVNFFIDESRLT